MSTFKPIKSKKYNPKTGASLYATQRKDFIQEFKTLPLSNTSQAYSMFRRSLGLQNVKAGYRPFTKTYNFPFVTQSKEYHKRREMTLSRFAEFLRQRLGEAPESSQNNLVAQATLTLKKLRHFQKILFGLRLRKSLTPKVVRFTSQLAKAAIKKDSPFSFYHRPYSRSSLLRFYSKRRKKVVRAHRTPRLKAIHFYIPTYLQRDFTTLRAIKIQSPSLEDIQYPFRISLAKRHSFYRAKGF